jgi:TonB family protein
VLGTVYDSSSAVIPGVELILSSEDNPDRQWTVRSGEVGRFEFSDLEAGRYILEVSLPGFRTLRNALDLRAGQEFRRDLVLAVGFVSERVEVQAPGRFVAPPPVPQGPYRIRVGGNVRPARLITHVQPIYPANLRDAGTEGTVVMDILIGADGVPRAFQVASSQAHPGLVAAASEAVSQWRYEPTQLNGIPVEVRSTVTIDFELVQ